MKEYHPGKPIFVAGDLNRPLKDAESLAQSLNLKVIPPELDDPSGHTRKEARIDYILAPAASCSS